VGPVYGDYPVPASTTRNYPDSAGNTVKCGHILVPGALYKLSLSGFYRDVISYLQYIVEGLYWQIGVVAAAK